MDLRFGALAAPEAADLHAAIELARTADASGLDFVSTYDWPHDGSHLDALVLMAALLGSTERIRALPNVLNLQARPPALLAKQAASLDRLYPGRFELGLGSGGAPFLAPVAAMGGEAWTRTGESVDALEEAIDVIRLFWRGSEQVSFQGRYYHLDEVHAGPVPAHPIGIWLGAYKPRMLALTGRAADGWIVSNVYAPPDAVPELTRAIDAGALQVGRDPGAVRRVYNVLGKITDEAAVSQLHGPPDHWVEQLTEFALELGFDTFVFWTREHRALDVRQLRLFAEEIVPGVRAAVSTRGTTVTR